MNLQLIPELIESRIFKSETSITSIDPKKIVEHFYICILCLSTLKYENERAAERYAEDTVKYSQFDSFKSSGTDLYNLAVGSLKHRQFPEMAFRRWLRQLVNDRDDRRQDYTMLTELESSLGISNSTLRSLRRISLDYKNASHTQKKNFWTTLYRYFTQNLKNLDLTPLIPKN